MTGPCRWQPVRNWLHDDATMHACLAIQKGIKWVAELIFGLIRNLFGCTDTKCNPLIDIVVLTCRAGADSHSKYVILTTASIANSKRLHS